MVLNKPVEMVATFDLEGKIIPWRFRYLKEDGSNIVIKVKSILFTEKQKVAGIEYLLFRCRSIIDGVAKEYEIKYITNNCRWILYRI